MGFPVDWFRRWKILELENVGKTLYCNWKKKKDYKDRVYCALTQCWLRVYPLISVGLNESTQSHVTAYCIQPTLTESHFPKSIVIFVQGRRSLLLVYYENFENVLCKMNKESPRRVLFRNYLFRERKLRISLHLPTFHFLTVFILHFVANATWMFYDIGRI